MGLLDTFIQSIQDLNPEWTKDRLKTAAGLLADFTPVVGDVKAGYDMVDSARQGNYGEAALNGLGLLPFIPAMGGVLHSKIPVKSFLNEVNLYVNPSESELSKLLKSSGKNIKIQHPNSDGIGALRVLKDKKGDFYVSDGNQVTHSDITNHLEIPYYDTTRGEAFDIQQYERMRRNW